ncbi:hypothetical protein ACE3NQ_05120 [Paenibacillus terreus]|uniref:Uncharacterized protein n=1 Tax=Paenibacillus terreus TaxID=1387834 RepID=A0ABV5B3N2_9BACL
MLVDEKVNSLCFVGRDTLDAAEGTKQFWKSEEFAFAPEFYSL